MYAKNVGAELGAELGAEVGAWTPQVELAMVNCVKHVETYGKTLDTKMTENTVTYAKNAGAELGAELGPCTL